MHSPFYRQLKSGATRSWNPRVGPQETHMVTKRSKRPTKSAPRTFTVGGKYSKRKSTQEKVTGEFFASGPGNLGLVMVYWTFIGAAVLLALVHIFGPPERGHHRVGDDGTVGRCE